MLTTARERGVVRNLKIDSHHLEERFQEALGLAQWQAKDQTQRDGRFDHQIRRLPLSAALAGRSRLPRINHIQRNPQREVATLYERAVSGRPVLDVVLGLVGRCCTDRNEARTPPPSPVSRTYRPGPRSPNPEHPAEAERAARQGRGSALLKNDYGVVCSSSCRPQLRERCHSHPLLRVRRSSPDPGARRRERNWRCTLRSSRSGCCR